MRDWSPGECEPVPGRTMPKFVVVERDYGAVAQKMAALGPLLDRLGTTTKAVTVDVGPEVAYLREINGVVRGGVADGRPRLDRDIHACEAILALSGTTNGRVAVAGFRGAGAAHRAAAGRPRRRARGQAASASPTPRPGRCR